MMKNKNVPRQFSALWLLQAFIVLSLLLGLLAAGHVLWLRHGSEAASRQVELVADLDDFLEIAKAEDEDEEAMWTALKEAGITSLGVPEMTVRRLVRDGRLTAVGGGELLSRSTGPQAANPTLQALLAAGQVQAEHTYLLTGDGELLDYLEETLCRRLRGECTLHVGGLEDNAVLEVPLGHDNLWGFGLGIWPQDLVLAQQYGWLVVPRLADYPAATAASIAEDFAALDQAQVRTVVFSGQAVLGAASQQVEATAAEMARRGWVPGAIESVTLLSHWHQSGLTELTTALDYQAARVYSIAPEYQIQLSNAELVEIWARSPWERNIRLLYVRPFIGAPVGTSLDRIVQVVKDTVAGLERAGYSTGPASTFPPFQITGYHHLALAAFTIGLGLLLLWRLDLFKPLPLLLLGFISLAAWLVLYRLGLATSLPKLTALILAILAPILAFQVLFSRWRHRWPRSGATTAGLGALLTGAAVDLLLASAISLAGALVLAATLGELPYLLEFDYFRGVKPALLLPLAAVAVLYVWHLGLGQQPAPASGGGRLTGMLQEASRWLRQPINLGHAVLAAVLAVAAFLILVRSGNQTREAVPALELLVRSWLENALAVRPRFKEFSVGHPLFIVAGWLLMRRPGPWLGLLAVAAAVGQTSLINSFQHLRTPLLISLLRTWHGLWLGALLGVLAVLVLELIWRGWQAWMARLPVETDGKGI